MQTFVEEAIAQSIRRKLSEDQRTCGQTIDVIVANGDIFLVGWCDNEEEKRVAKFIVEGTYGVHSVIDNIRVRRIVQSI